MKTLEEKACDYAEKFRYSSVVKGWHESKTESFIAGYKAAQEWISVDDELPKDGTYIVMIHKGFSQEDISFIFYENSDESDLKANFTHWRPINND